jgi:general secretion pathway protein K
MGVGLPRTHIKSDVKFRRTSIRKSDASDGAMVIKVATRPKDRPAPKEDQHADRLLQTLVASKTEVTRDKSEDGIALIAVLWALALLSIMAAAFSFEARTGARIARNLTDNAAARAAADAGIQRAILMIASTRERSNDEIFGAGGKSYVWRFANFTIRISVRDERGKIDLDHAPEALLASLFATVGVDPSTSRSLAAAVADFRDIDDLRRLNGAEDSEYRTVGLAWGPKNAPFEAVEELQQVLGVTPSIYQRVAPHLTIYSIAGEISPAAADEVVVGSLQKALIGEEYFVRFPGMAYSIRAVAKRSDGAVFVREAVVQLDLESTIPIRILAWRQGVLTDN